MPGVHDRGGWATSETIDQSEHQWMDWERQASALLGVLSRKGLTNVDEFRRGVESISPDEYEALSYFERWSASIETILVGNNILTTEEIDAKVKVIEERWR